eukprot:scpid13335/ scgid1916/ Protein ANKUB1; Ankyrin repeat and ubiquitin domain-containing 1
MPMAHRKGKSRFLTDRESGRQGLPVNTRAVEVRLFRRGTTLHITPCTRVSEVVRRMRQEFRIGDSEHLWLTCNGYSLQADWVVNDVLPYRTPLFAHVRLVADPILQIKLPFRQGLISVYHPEDIFKWKCEDLREWIGHETGIPSSTYRLVVWCSERTHREIQARKWAEKLEKAKAKQKEQEAILNGVVIEEASESAEESPEESRPIGEKTIWNPGGVQFSSGIQLGPNPFTATNPLSYRLGEVETNYSRGNMDESRSEEILRERLSYYGGHAPKEYSEILQSRAKERFTETFLDDEARLAMEPGGGRGGAGGGGGMGKHISFAHPPRANRGEKLSRETVPIEMISPVVRATNLSVRRGESPFETTPLSLPKTYPYEAGLPDPFKDEARKKWQGQYRESTDEETSGGERDSSTAANTGGTTQSPVINHSNCATAGSNASTRDSPLRLSPDATPAPASEQFPEDFGLGGDDDNDMRYKEVQFGQCLADFGVCKGGVLWLHVWDGYSPLLNYLMPISHIKPRCSAKQLCNFIRKVTHNEQERDFMARTALHIATHRNDAMLVNTLMESGLARPDKKIGVHPCKEWFSGYHFKRDKDCAVHVAVDRGNLYLVQMFVDKFPSCLTVRNGEGHTASELAQRHRFGRIASFLDQRKATTSMLREQRRKMLEKREQREIIAKKRRAAQAPGSMAFLLAGSLQNRQNRAANKQPQGNTSHNRNATIGSNKTTQNSKRSALKKEQQQQQKQAESKKGGVKVSAAKKGNDDDDDGDGSDDSDDDNKDNQLDSDESDDCDNDSSNSEDDGSSDSEDVGEDGDDEASDIGSDDDNEDVQGGDELDGTPVRVSVGKLPPDAPDLNLSGAVIKPDELQKTSATSPAPTVEQSHPPELENHLLSAIAVRYTPPQLDKRPSKGILARTLDGRRKQSADGVKTKKAVVWNTAIVYYSPDRKRRVTPKPDELRTSMENNTVDGTTADDENVTTLESSTTDPYQSATDAGKGKKKRRKKEKKKKRHANKDSVENPPSTAQTITDQDHSAVAGAEGAPRDAGMYSFDSLDWSVDDGAKATEESARKYRCRVCYSCDLHGGVRKAPTPSAVVSRRKPARPATPFHELVAMATSGGALEDEEEDEDDEEEKDKEKDKEESTGSESDDAGCASIHTMKLAAEDALKADSTLIKYDVSDPDWHTKLVDKIFDDVGTINSDDGHAVLGREWYIEGITPSKQNSRKIADPPYLQHNVQLGKQAQTAVKKSRPRPKLSPAHAFTDAGGRRRATRQVGQCVSVRRAAV